jgi:hypothetical protein
MTEYVGSSIPALTPNVATTKKIADLKISLMASIVPHKFFNLHW